MLLSCELAMSYFFVWLICEAVSVLFCIWSGRFFVQMIEHSMESVWIHPVCVLTRRPNRCIFDLVDVLSRPAFLQWVIDCISRALYHFAFCFVHWCSLLNSFCINF